MTLANFRNLGKKIVCVGRNYKDHALELGNPIPTKPMLFLKSANAFVQEGHPIITPVGCENLHQEVELGVIIGKTAKFTTQSLALIHPSSATNIDDAAFSTGTKIRWAGHVMHVINGNRWIRASVTRSEAMLYVAGYTVALDMTARDFQDEAKKGGAPWFLAKSFDTACPVSKFIPKEEIPDPHAEELFCLINGVEKQRCKTDVMIFDIPTLIEYTTRFVTLEEGDLLLTGTPAGETAMNGDIRNDYIHSQDGIPQTPPVVYYYNPVGVHLKKMDYTGFCECRVKVWSEQFHNTVSITLMIIVLGTFAMLYFWAGYIFERRRLLVDFKSSHDVHH
ncbi:hypothetical protein RB195_003877 [Necator americanus]|uniref:oxaloacetate tautomerase n=3 Tax=Necator americanus TaxID=51031 RepID=A0ABR1DQS4_NECAM